MKVLICCDNSPAAHHILEAAQKFLSSFSGLDLHICSVMDMAVVSVAGLYANTDVMKSLESQANEVKKLAEGIFSGTDIHFESVLGYPAEAILKQTADLKVDLLILGTHGKTGVNRVLLGSVAENVLRHANCNTLIIPIKHL